MHTATSAEPLDPPLTCLTFLKLMPLLIVAYVLRSPDRSNIALAKPGSCRRGLRCVRAGLGLRAYALSDAPGNRITHRGDARF